MLSHVVVVATGSGQWPCVHWLVLVVVAGVVQWMVLVVSGGI